MKHIDWRWQQQTERPVVAKGGPSLRMIARNFAHLHAPCGCMVRSCHRSGCTIILPPGTTCLDCDHCHAFTTAKKPDFILLDLQPQPAGSLWFVVEMQTRAGHPNDIAQQLQAGADTIGSDARFAFPQAPGGLRPVVLHEKGNHVADLQVLSSKRIRFAGKVLPIRVAGCPATLTALRE